MTSTSLSDLLEDSDWVRGVFPANAFAIAPSIPLK